jgi:hypothetical protein
VEFVPISAMGLVNSLVPVIAIFLSAATKILPPSASKFSYRLNLDFGHGSVIGRLLPMPGRPTNSLIDSATPD